MLRGGEAVRIGSLWWVSHGLAERLGSIQLAAAPWPLFSGLFTSSEMMEIESMKGSKW